MARLTPEVKALSQSVTGHPGGWYGCTSQSNRDEMSGQGFSSHATVAGMSPSLKQNCTS
jgi:hypothetical protein